MNRIPRDAMHATAPREPGQLTGSGGFSPRPTSGPVNHGGPLLVTADRIRTFGPEAAPADALLIQDGRVRALGRAPDLARLRPAERLDLTGTTITPGLADSHIHITEWAIARLEADLSRAVGPAEAAATLGAHAARRPAGWLKGRGWNPHRWSETPHRSHLDQVIGDRPAALQSHDMHALWVSSAALRAAGIDAHTPDPEGGRIVRDAAGQPTGLLLENAGTLVTRVLPAPSFAETVDAVLDAQKALHAVGITAMHVLPGLFIPEPNALELLRSLRDQGHLTLRSLVHIPLDALDTAIEDGVRSGDGDDWLRIGGVKMFLDGALGSLTAWMQDPYENSASRGVQVLPADVFEATAQRAAHAGIATTVHAIGDAAVALALDVLCAPSLPRLRVPHRIEHVQCCPAGRLRDAGRVGVVASVQPSHLMTDWRAADRHWGARAQRTYAFRSLLDGGAVLAFGSDAPVEPPDPRHALYAAVARRDLEGHPAGGWQPPERLTLEQAFRASTSGPAAAAGWGDIGSLAPGALADFVAWTRDPFAMNENELLELECAATFAGGQPVHALPGIVTEAVLAN